MKPVVLPLVCGRYLMWHKLADAKGVMHDFFPAKNDIPMSLHLRFDGGERMYEIGCRYRKMPGTKEEALRVRQGSIIIHDDSRLLLRLDLAAPATEPTPYDQTTALLRAYLSFAQLRSSEDERSVRMLFSAEILNEFWKKEEAVIRALLTNAPYR